jgi:hypothetical protein
MGAEDAAGIGPASNAGPALLLRCYPRIYPG